MCLNIKRWNLQHWLISWWARQQRSPAPGCAQRRRPHLGHPPQLVRQNIKHGYKARVRCSKSDTKQMECWPDTDHVHLKSRHADTSRSMLLVFKNNLCHSAMNNLLSKRKIWKSPVTPFARLSLSGREDEDYYDYYYDDEVDRDDKDVSARSRAEVSRGVFMEELQIFYKLPSL